MSAAVFNAAYKEAISLLELLNPEASSEEIKKVVNFGFHLAASPWDFIEALREQFK